MEISLKLTVEEVNYILQSLGRLPFAEVNGLIAKIKALGEAELAKLPQEAQPEALTAEAA